MACPYFIPEQRCDAELWAHRARLPLGDGFRGRCCAGVGDYRPSESELRDLCNIGYAKSCPRLPQERAADSVRFMARAAEGFVAIKYLLERGHAPVSHGELQYDRAAAAWRGFHPDARVQAQAQCYLESYLARHPAALARASAK
jgi:hypothetical protein